MLPVYKTRVGQKLEEIRSRHDLQQAQRIVIKAGTSMIVNDDGYPHLRQISNICEEIVTLRREGRDVILVSSGAIGIGRNIINRQEVMMTSAHEQLHQAAVARSKGRSAPPVGGVASIGQTQLSNLWYTLFSQLDMVTSDILLSKFDFETETRRENLIDTIETCLAHGVLPIINENDAVTCSYNKSAKDVFNDNDGLAALVSSQLHADLLVILTDVDGVYDRPPSEAGAQVIDVLGATTPAEGTPKLKFGDKGSMGRGGMESKVAAAQRAVDCGVPAVTIVSGRKVGVVARVVRGEHVGTLVVANPGWIVNNNPMVQVRQQALAAKEGSLKLSQLSGEERARVLLAIADAFESEKDAIFAANAKDLELASINKIALPLRNRLELSAKKLATVCSGIRALAASPDPLGRIRSQMEIAEGVTLTKVTAPIGVLLIIFESRPDSLPQIAALSILSGNGLLLKGGREARHSNEKLHSIIAQTLERTTGRRVPASTIGLVSSREEITELLRLDKYIDLVIPRGSKQLVEQIQNTTKIPVMGHADGVCHVYIHSAADIDRAAAILVDAKTNYPAACNAVETVLIDAAHVRANGGEAAKALVIALEEVGVVVFGGPRALAAKLAVAPAESLHMEYGDLRVCVEIVDGVEEAAAHINAHGSHHTDVIVTEDDAASAAFIRAVDSACVFHNASSRMADGFRFGLGAEVGISTSRIHARGPVGVDGLLTEKWVLVDANEAGSGHAPTTATSFEKGAAQFTHRLITPSDNAAN